MDAQKGRAEHSDLEIDGRIGDAVGWFILLLVTRHLLVLVMCRGSARTRPAAQVTPQQSQVTAICRWETCAGVTFGRALNRPFAEAEGNRSKLLDNDRRCHRAARQTCEMRQGECEMEWSECEMELSECEMELSECEMDAVVRRRTSLFSDSPPRLTWKVVAMHATGKMRRH